MASMSSGDDESLRLCVFDLRRGQTEGQELDKILFFHPPDLHLSAQLSVTGLSEGLITFTRSASTPTLLLISWLSIWIFVEAMVWSIKCRLFSPEAACEVIEAERHSHVFHEPEPDIWMVMVTHSLYLLHVECQWTESDLETLGRSWRKIRIQELYGGLMHSGECLRKYTHSFSCSTGQLEHYSRKNQQESLPDHSCIPSLQII